MGEQVGSVRASLGEAGDGVAGLAAHAHRAAVAFAPLGGDQTVQEMRGGAGDFLHGGVDRFQHQPQIGQFTGRGQDVGAVGALAAPGLDQPGGHQAFQGQIEELVGTVVLGEAVAEVAQDAVVEVRVVLFECEGDSRPGRPSRGYHASKSSSRHSPSSRSRTHIVVPRGLLARTICAVSGET